MEELVNDLNQYFDNNARLIVKAEPIAGSTPGYKFRAGLNGSELSQYEFRLFFQPTNQNQYELVLRVLQEGERKVFNAEVGRIGSHADSIDLSGLCSKIIKQSRLYRELREQQERMSGHVQDPYDYGGW